MTTTDTLALGAQLERLLTTAETDADRDATYAVTGIVRDLLTGTQLHAAIETAVHRYDHTSTTTDQPTPAPALARRCPTCDAAPGMPCVTLDDQRRPRAGRETHAARRRDEAPVIA